MIRLSLQKKQLFVLKSSKTYWKNLDINSICIFFYSYNDIHIVCCKLSIQFFMQKDKKLYADCCEVCSNETCDANSVNCLDLF